VASLILHYADGRQEEVPISLWRARFATGWFWDFEAVRES